MILLPIFLISYVVIWNIVKIVDKACEKRYDSHLQLFDIIHKITNSNYWSKFLYYIDGILIFVIMASVIDILIYRGFSQLLHMLKINMIGHWIRCICFISTQLPSPSITMRTMISYGRHDLVISGHVFTMVISCMAITNIYLYYIAIIGTTMVSWLIISSREHYTIDVILGIVIGISLSKSFQL